MKIAVIAAAVGAAAVALTGAAAVGWAAKRPPAKHPPAHHAAAKAAPACSSLGFKALPTAGAEGEQTAGLYKSRLARLELRATVQNGAATNYYVVANGTRPASAQGLPETAASCAATKKMPKPQTTAGACTGDRFTVVVAHAGQQRFAMLYAQHGGAWSYCGAGTF
jgi:hypothetical protein